MRIAKALTIAGSDSGGGAGIQADIKTFQELGVYGMSVITVITAQNTLGVQGVYPQSLDCIARQLDSVLSDIGTDAVKTGMLYSEEIIDIIAGQLEQYGVKNVVVDPVMLAKGGTPLLQQEAIAAMKTRLFPLATVITPNLPEASSLLGIPEIRDPKDMPDIARRLLAYGPKYVLLKGGHLQNGESIDWLVDHDQAIPFVAPRVFTKHTHGTGCTFAAAVTSELAKGKSMQEATESAKRFIHAAIRHALPIGHGIGPTHHGAHRLQEAVSQHKKTAPRSRAVDSMSTKLRDALRE